MPNTVEDIELPDADALKRKTRAPAVVEDDRAAPAANAASIEQRYAELNKQKDRVLVPTQTLADGSTKYVPIDEYKAQSGKSGQALKDDLDQKAILIKTLSNTYLTKNQLYENTYSDPSKSTAERQIERDANFKKRTDDLGLSDKNFANQLPKGPDFETYRTLPDGGKRYRVANFENPIQAGENSPDVLIRKNGDFIAFNITKDGNIKSVADLQKDVDLGRDDILLKTTGNSYVPLSNYNQRKGVNADEKLVARYSGTTFHQEREDLAPAFYKLQDKEIYISGKEYAKREQKGEILPDKNTVDVLFQAPSGKALVTARVLKKLDPEGASKTFVNEGLSPDFTSRYDLTKPPVLVRLNGDIIASAEAAKPLAAREGKTVAELVPYNDVYQQNVSKITGKPTGNYNDRESFEAKNSLEVSRNNLLKAGVIAQDQSVVKIAQEFSAFPAAPAPEAKGLQGRYNRPDRSTEVRAL